MTMPPADPPAGPRRPSRERAAGKASLLGEGFAIGVATAGYQIEGGYNGDGEPANNWYAWERSGRVERSAVACDFWAHPEEALDRAAEIGCTVFRLSVEWARLEPEAGRFDEAALDRYVEILEMCATPRARPHDHAAPLHPPRLLGGGVLVAARIAGPLRPPRGPRAAGAGAPLPEMGDHQRAQHHDGEGLDRRDATHPVGAPPSPTPSACWTISSPPTCSQPMPSPPSSPGLSVTCNPGASSIYDLDRLLTDLLLLRAVGDPGLRRRPLRRRAPGAARRRAAAATCRGVRVAAVLRRHQPVRDEPGRRAGARCGRSSAPPPAGPRPGGYSTVVEASPQTSSLGAIGFDWYDPVASHALGRPGRRNAWGALDWSPGRHLWDVPPHADGLRSWCRTEAALHPELPLWVVENGMATRKVDGYPVPRRDGWDRPRYLREHFAALVAATEEDAPVTAYLHWSLVDNYEWGTYEPRFGLFGLDRNPATGAVRWLDTDAAGHDSAGRLRPHRQRLWPRGSVRARGHRLRSARSAARPGSLTMRRPALRHAVSRALPIRPSRLPPLSAWRPRRHRSARPSPSACAGSSIRR